GDECLPVGVKGDPEAPGLRRAGDRVAAGESRQGELRDVVPEMLDVALPVLPGANHPDRDALHARDGTRRGRQAASEAASRDRRLRWRRPVNPTASQRSKYCSSAVVNQRRAKVAPRASAAASRAPAARRTSGSRNSELPTI